MRSANPSMRVGSDLSLGPRTQVDVKNIHWSSLQPPEEYFFALDVFQTDNPARELKQGDTCWELINGKWVEGVLTLNW